MYICFENGTLCAKCKMKLNEREVRLNQHMICANHLQTIAAGTRFDLQMTQDSDQITEKVYPDQMCRGVFNLAHMTSN